MNLKAVKFGVFTFAILVCGSFSVFSQNNCNLQFNVYEFKDYGSAEQYPVKDAKFKLISENGKSIKISNKNGVHSAIDLAEGKYFLTVSKAGFQNTHKNISVECNSIEFENFISEIIFLWKGKSSEKIEMHSGYFGTRKSDEGQTSNNATKSQAIYLGKPVYPVTARFAKARGEVKVEVSINELGYVTSAKAISGHSLLHSASVEAAMKSKFQISMFENIPVKIKGIITFNFN